MALLGLSFKGGVAGIRFRIGGETCQEDECWEVRFLNHERRFGACVETVEEWSRLRGVLFPRMASCIGRRSGRRGDAGGTGSMPGDRSLSWGEEVVLFNHPSPSTDGAERRFFFWVGITLDLGWISTREKRLFFLSGLVVGGSYAESWRVTWGLSGNVLS